MVAENIFIELSLVVLVAVIISFIVRILKQPLIIGYVITGIIASPYLLNLVSSANDLATFAKIGIAILLFMVGLNLNPKVIKDVGKVALITGVSQIAFTFTFGFLISKLFGLSTIVSAYLAIAISFSSTIVIMKLISDKNELDSLYGKISIGFLIFQDLVAIIVLIIISSFSEAPNLSFLIFETLLKGAGLIIGLFGLGIYVLPKLTKYAAKSQELLLLFSIGWALAIASLFNYFNFSIEIGALLAGVTLSLSQYRYEISSKIKPIRDFFILIFFIFLGSQMSFDSIGPYKNPIIILSLLILVGNPIIVMTIMGLLGYTKRSSFMSALSLSQISEFSFIIISLGVTKSHIPQEILGVVTAIGLITMALSSYMILYSNKLYPLLSKYLSLFEKKGAKVDEGKYHIDENYDIILFGYNRIGYTLLKTFKKAKKKCLVVDYNPDTILKLARKGTDSRYGDASDSELLETLPLKGAKMIISTIPELETNLTLITKIKQINRTAALIAVSYQIDDALKLYETGATYVITPHFLGGEYASSLIEKYGLHKESLQEEGLKKIKELKQRKKDDYTSLDNAG